MILHSDQEGNDCIWKLRCHCIQILHSYIYSVIIPYISPKASWCRTGNTNWAYAVVASRALPSNSQPLPTSQTPPKYVHSSTVLTLICQEGNSSCIQLLMLSDISTSAAHRGKIAEKVHKPPLGVNVINFELNGFTESIWVSWSPSDQKYIMHW